MANLNKVFLMGNLTRDPDLRSLPSGAVVTEFGLAINRRYTTASGEAREETCFVDIVVWGRQAESCHRFLKKGSLALVEGRLQMDQWQDRETGRNRSRLRIVAERVQFMNLPGTQGEAGRPPENEPRFDSQTPPPAAPGGYQPSQSTARRANAVAPPEMPPPDALNNTNDDVDEVDDDIPF